MKYGRGLVEQIGDTQQEANAALKQIQDDLQAPVVAKLKEMLMTAPRITPEDIENAIQSVYYITGDKMIVHANSMQHRGKGQDVAQAAQVLTVCMMVLKNGFIVLGHSAPVSPQNFDKAQGEKIAYDKCIAQVWPLMGFALKDKLTSV